MPRRTIFLVSILLCVFVSSFPASAQLPQGQKDPLSPTQSAKSSTACSVSDTSSCAQLDVSDTEQAVELLALCVGLSGSFCPCGNCAEAGNEETKTQRSIETRKIVRRGMNGPSFLWNLTLAFRCSLAEQIIPNGARSEHLFVRYGRRRGG